MTCKVSTIIDNPVSLSVLCSSLRSPSLDNLGDSNRKKTLHLKVVKLDIDIHLILLKQIQTQRYNINTGSFLKTIKKIFKNILTNIKVCLPLSDQSDLLLPTQPGCYSSKCITGASDNISPRKAFSAIFCFFF